jgi:hypothetical protein
MGFIAGKWIAFRPSFLFQIRNDVLPGDRNRTFTGESPDLLNSGRLMPDTALLHPVRRLPGKFVEPKMNLGIRLTEEPFGFLAVLFETRHGKSPSSVFDSKRIFSVRSVREVRKM